MFSALSTPPTDALHSVMARFNADPRTDKIDLGLGVYRDIQGNSPVMRAVKAAEEQLVATQTSKSYLELRGNQTFLDGMAKLVFAQARPDRVAAIQCVGGTGGVRLALELTALSNPGATVHVGVPTWPNHLSICELVGLPVTTYPYFDTAQQSVQLEQTLVALERAQAGDVFVLHGPCHNPSGADLSVDDLQSLVALAAAKGVVPLLDVAYYGLGNPLEEDMPRLAQLLLACPEAYLVLSCSKAFGLYRERTGALFAACEGQAHLGLVQGHLEMLARGSYSMPPDHGAAVVGQILVEPHLKAMWSDELAGMRLRVKAVRDGLAEAGKDLEMLSAIDQQRGIFSLLPTTPEAVAALAEQHGIYLPSVGRINLAGFKSGDIERFVAALTSVASA